jgi:hypothetical protein
MSEPDLPAGADEPTEPENLGGGSPGSGEGPPGEPADAPVEPEEPEPTAAQRAEREADAARWDQPGEVDDEEEDSYTREHRTVPDEKIQRFLRYGVDGNEFGGGAAFGANSMAAGTINFYQDVRQTNGKVRCAEISAGGIAALRDTYVRTKTDSQLAQVLMTRGLTFLSGERGTGRETAAWIALAERHGDNRVVALILPDDVPMAEVSHDLVEALRPETGHLLRLSGNQPDRGVMSALNQAALEGGAAVVAVGDVPFTDRHLIRPYAVPHDPPDSHEVFRRCLRHFLTDRCVGACSSCEGSCRDRYVAECLSDPEIAGELRRLSSPEEAVEAASALAEDRPTGAEAGHLLRGVAAVRLRQDAEAVISDVDYPGHPYREQVTQHRRAFRICYALLDGLPLRDVFDATELLRGLLSQDRGWEQSRHPTYDMPVGDLLGQELDRLRTRTPPDPGHGQVAQLRNDHMIAAILDVVWNDYSGFRGPLLRLLNELVSRGQGPVRQQAATVAGVLAGHDFEHVDSELITGWSKSRRVAVRQAAAYALDVTVRYNDGLAETVRNRVRHWASSSSTLLRDTAARCYATRLGASHPDKALDHLKRIAEDPMQLRRPLIGDAVANLAVHYPVAELFHSLASWFNPLDSLVTVHGIRAFVRLAELGDGSAGIPKLMQLFIDGDVDKSAGPAWEMLKHWITVLESTMGIGSGAEVVRDLFRGIFANPAMRTRGHFYLSVWRRDPSWAGLRWFAEILGER